MAYKRKYYVQDSRRGTIVGNSVSWWRPNGKGYTCDIRDAGVYDEDEIKTMREEDIPWPVEDINRIVQHHVDCQDLARIKKEGSRILPHTLKRGIGDWAVDEAEGLAKPGRN